MKEVDKSTSFLFYFFYIKYDDENNEDQIKKEKIKSRNIEKGLENI